MQHVTVKSQDGRKLGLSCGHFYMLDDDDPEQASFIDAEHDCQKAHCPECHYGLDADDHVFNVRCAISNAEYDKLLQEIRNHEIGTA